MSFFATFNSEAYYGACPNVSVTTGSASPSFCSALAKRSLSADCSCKDCSYGGVIELGKADSDEPFTKGSVPARLDAFLAQTPASRADALGSQTGSGSGFAWAKDCAYVADGRLALVLAGFVVGLDDTDEADDGMTPAERSAWSLLGYYYEHALSDVDVLKTELVAGLSSLSGDWAFVLCDRTHHRVVAARSSSGGVPLAWAEAPSGCLMFATVDDSALEAECEAAPFPPGCVFVSSVADKLFEVAVNRACPGRLVSFTASGGGIRKVRSRGFVHSSSGQDVRLISSSAGGMKQTPSMKKLAGSTENLARLAVA